MTHVQIKTHPEAAGAPGVFQIIVDGVDMSLAVLVEGFGVTFPKDPEDPARVTMVVGADVLDVDLPNAVVEALREQEASA